MPKFTRPPLYLPWDDAIRELSKFIPERDLRDAQCVPFGVTNALTHKHSVPSVKGWALYWPEVEKLWPDIASGLYMESREPLILRSREEKKQRRGPQRDRLEPVVCELYGPSGVAPDHIPNPKIIKDVTVALKANGLKDTEMPDRKTILRRVGRMKS